MAFFFFLLIHVVFPGRERRLINLPPRCCCCCFCCLNHVVENAFHLSQEEDGEWKHWMMGAGQPCSFSFVCSVKLNYQQTLIAIQPFISSHFSLFSAAAARPPADLVLFSLHLKVPQSPFEDPPCVVVGLLRYHQMVIHKLISSRR